MKAPQLPADTGANAPTRRRLLTGAGASAAAGLLAGCVPGAQGASGVVPGASSDNVLVIAMTASDIPILDTGLSSNQGYEGTRFVGNQLWDGLTRFDLTSAEQIPPVVPGLATRWTRAGNGEDWTFTLREGVTFHDGTPFDADAVLFNFDRYLNKSSPHFYPELNSQAGLAISGIRSVTRTGPMEIRVSTEGPLSYLPSNLTTVLLASPTAVRKYGNKGFQKHPVGTGPFRFHSVARGRQLVLRANPDYWNGAPRSAYVVLQPIPDATARVAALRAGQVHWIEVPPPDDVPQLAKEGYQVLTNSYDHVWPWIIDTTRKPFDDVRVRRAMNYAVDREGLIRNVLQGTADPAYQAVARANTAYRPANDLYRHDPARARQLLREAGRPHGFSATLSYPTSGSGNMVPGPMNEALQQNLAEVGIKVKLEPVEWASMISSYYAGRIPGGADMINISLTMQQEGFWASFFGGDSPLNVSRLRNPRVDALFRRARAAFDDAERAGIYAEAARLITDDAPWVFIVDDRNPRALLGSVKGFVEPRSWFCDLTTVHLA
ncbi:ABC transporter substrate-binding protein [Streptomyces sp. NPDC050560]|uniref:ABC transporter substrate-binding protein n=1 Tax=Streptomyces sp. NPDC050560 TaxID=3365630 RepID=UPI0037A70082